MTDFYFIKGGPCIPECLPICEGCNEKDRSKHLPYPHRVAGEYGRGDFTLGQTFNPVWNDRQRTALTCKPAAIDDFFPLILVPPHHTIHEVFTEVVTDQEFFGDIYRSHVNNMAGLTYDIEARIMDENGVQTGTVPLTGLTGINGATPAVMRAAVEAALGGHFNMTGQWVEIGFKLTGLPTTPGVTMDRISGYIAVVAKVGDFQYPMHL